MYENKYALEPVMLPRSGDVLRITREASVQFDDPMLFRVIRIHDWPTYEGWVWIDGYQLNSRGEAVERRSIFVKIDGLRMVGTVPDVRQRNARTSNPDPRQRSRARRG